MCGYTPVFARSASDNNAHVPRVAAKVVPEVSQAELSPDV